MPKPLDKPPSGPTWDWRVFKDWFFRLWQNVKGILGDASGNTIILGNLTVDGTTTLQGQLVTPYIAHSRAINGQMTVAQRASFVASSGAQGYGGPDHYFVWNSSAGGQFTQSTGSLVYQGVTYNTLQQTVNTTITDNSGNKFWSGVLMQAYEGYQVVDLVGSPVSISFLFSANFTGTISIAFRFIKGTTYEYLTSFSYPTANVVQYVTITTPPVPSTVTVAFDNTYTADLWIGALNAGIYQGAASTSWQANNFITATGYFNWGTAGNVTNVTLLQVVRGPSTPFEWRHFEEDALLCQRYFQAGVIGFIGNAAAGGFVGDWYNLAVSMRANPTIVLGTATENVNTNGISITVFTTRDIRIWTQALAAGQCYYDGPFTASAELL